MTTDGVRPLGCTSSKRSGMPPWHSAMWPSARSDMKKVMKRLRVLDGGNSGSSSRPSPLAPAVAGRGKCPLCNVRNGETEIKIGFVYTKVCEPCSKPVWHAFGLFEFFKSRL